MSFQYTHCENTNVFMIYYKKIKKHKLLYLSIINKIHMEINMTNEQQTKDIENNESKKEDNLYEPLTITIKDIKEKMKKRKSKLIKDC